MNLKLTSSLVPQAKLGSKDDIVFVPQERGSAVAESPQDQSPMYSRFIE